MSTGTCPAYFYGEIHIPVAAGMKQEAFNPAPAASGVTVLLPVYKRLEYLPAALESVERQDHPHIELIVSDNGNNGEALRQLVMRHYSRPFVFRQNRVSVPVVEHFNQLFDAASMPYVTLLCDDDEISEEFVSELAALLDRDPAAHIALARPETIERGVATRLGGGRWPSGSLPGDEFLRAYTAREIRLASTVTNMARTASVRRCGKYAALPRALYSDNLLLTKLALMGDVAFAERATFRWRVDDSSTGFSAAHQEVADACRGFLRALDTDPQFMAYAAAHDAAWPSLKRDLASHCGRWYFYRWRDRYSRRLSHAEWLRAAFLLPYIPSYYEQVWDTLSEAARSWVKARWPSVHRAYAVVSGRAYK
jgi:glycosyltransferase involved in cell wall biosynthesis